MTKKNPSNVSLDEYEQEIENQLEKAQRLSLKEERKELTIAQRAAAQHNRTNVLHKFAIGRLKDVRR